MPMAGRVIVQSIGALLIVGFLALLGILGMVVWFGERSQTYFDDALRTRDIRAFAVELRSAIQSAESSQRGFVLTGNEIYLSPYNSAKVLAARQLDQLKRAPAWSGLPEIIKRLDRSITDKVSEMDQSVSLKIDRKEAEALAVIKTNRGKALMDEINLFVSGIVRSADDRLTAGVTEQRANAARLRAVSLIASLLIVLVVSGVVLMIYRYTREITQARDEIIALNESLEHRVAVRTADLAVANEEIQRFAHIISHDLRAPLVNIVGFTNELGRSVKEVQEYLARGDAGGSSIGSDNSVRRIINDEMPEAIDFINSSTRKMDSLISSILTLSREGKRTLQSTQIDLSDLIQSSAAAIQHQLSENGGEIALDLGVDHIVSDRLAVEQVIGNLLDNAIKYRSKSRPLRIVVASTSIQDKVSIKVSDNGRGIGESDLGQIFELFKRVGVRDQQGEGVGLAYVQMMVRNLGGDISVTSSLGEGTTFTLSLPRILKPQS